MIYIDIYFFYFMILLVQISNVHYSTTFFSGILVDPAVCYSFLFICLLLEDQGVPEEDLLNK